MRSRRGSLVAALTIGVVAGFPLPTTTAAQEEGVTLTLLHNGDGESSLLPQTSAVGEDARLSVGGIAAFKSVTLRELADARALGHSVLDVYSGDAFLASATLACNAPEDPGISSLPADAIAQAQIPYDVHVFGNHEFDYGPDFLQRFIFGFVGETGVEQPFLSANLDFSAEPGWSGWIDEDGIVETPVTDSRIVGRSAIVTDVETGERFGVVGATAPQLPDISSPRGVAVTPDLATTAAAVQAEIDRLAERGVDRIILVSHMQDFDDDKELVAQLTGVDIAVAGGSDVLLANDPAELLPGEDPEGIEGTYPTVVTDAAGRDVHLVATAGEYRYLGRLDVTFGPDGEITEVLPEASGPRRVVPLEQEGDQIAALGIGDAVESDAEMITTVVAGVTACLDAR